MGEIYGACRDAFPDVRKLDTGASPAELIDGEPVVDIRGGHVGFTPNLGISGPHDQTRSRNIVRDDCAGLQ